MRRMRIPLLAVDGGGTKCLAAFVDSERHILGMGQAGACNYQGVGTAAAARELRSAIQQAMSAAAVASDRPGQGAEWEVECAVFALAGLDTAPDRQVIVPLVKGVLDELRIRTDNLIVENDGYVALLGATRGEAGVLINAGTGSVVYGVNRQGVTARAGGWGHRVGDEGSGLWIGRQVIAAVFRAADGRDEPTVLRELLLAQLGLANVEALLDWLYGSSYSVEQVAQLSPLVSQAAAAGDVVAARILERAAAELFQAAQAVIRQLAMRDEAFRLFLQGGVLQHAEGVRRLLVEKIRRFSPRVIVDDYRSAPIDSVINQGLSYLNGENRGERSDAAHDE